MTTQTFPILPQGHKRFSVEQLLIELAPCIGLRGGRLHALLYMMKQTAPDDWTRPDREPVFYAPQDQTAEALNKTRRALYNDEAALEGLGLIEKRVKGNGSRSPFGGWVIPPQISGVYK
jgi:replication initiation protein RepC